MFKYHCYCYECGDEWKENHQKENVICECDCGNQIEAGYIENLIEPKPMASQHKESETK